MATTTSHDSLSALADQHLDAVIAAMAGPDATPRDDQRAAVRALVADRNRVLVVQATGWGKSAVYWAATSALRADGSGPTFVISPLLALMRDQIDAAGRAGLTAATINSANVDDWDATLEALGRDELDVLLISPERLANPKFARRATAMLAKAGLIVIDEAHCISDWGFDFRPDYQRISRILTHQADSGVPVLATTATANERVTTDIAAQLGEHTTVLRGTLARSSLQLAVIDELGPLERYAWTDRALQSLAGSGIIYVATVAETQRLTAYLRHRGHDVAAYSGQLDPAERARTEDALRANEVKAVVATSALGMGYDKPDLAFCLHLGSPDSPVAYYQQIGRAGRALDDAVVVLLPAETDERLWEYFATASIPKRDEVVAVLGALDDERAPMSVPALESATGLRRGRIEQLLRVVAVEGVVERVDGGWVSTGSGYTHDQAKWDEVREVRAREADIMRAYARGRGCLMMFLQQALDDPAPAPCGRCSVCTGELPEPGRELDPDDIEAARTFLRGADVVIDPRKRWPGGVSRKGAITGCDPGRALVFADTPGWGEAIKEMSGRDGPLSDELVAGLVKVLTRWKGSWAARPVAVVPMPSRRFPVRVHDRGRAHRRGGQAPRDRRVGRHRSPTAGRHRGQAPCRAPAGRPLGHRRCRAPLGAAPPRRRHLPLGVDRDGGRRPAPRRRRLGRPAPGRPPAPVGLVSPRR